MATIRPIAMQPGMINRVRTPQTRMSQSNTRELPGPTARAVLTRPKPARHTAAIPQSEKGQARATAVASTQVTISQTARTAASAPPGQDAFGNALVPGSMGLKSSVYGAGGMAMRRVFDGTGREIDPRTNMRLLGSDGLVGLYDDNWNLQGFAFEVSSTLDDWREKHEAYMNSSGDAHEKYVNGLKKMFGTATPTLATPYQVKFGIAAASLGLNGLNSGFG